MTNIQKPTPTSRSSRKGSPALLPRHWHLHDAKAKFSELVRRVRSEGPQHVTVHGRDEVVVISAEDFRNFNSGASGQLIVNAMQASPFREIDLEPQGFPMPVREVDV